MTQPRPEFVGVLAPSGAQAMHGMHSLRVGLRFCGRCRGRRWGRRWGGFLQVEPLRGQGQFLFALLVEALQFGVRAFSFVWVFTKDIGHRGFL